MAALRANLDGTERLLNGALLSASLNLGVIGGGMLADIITIRYKLLFNYSCIGMHSKILISR